MTADERLKLVRRKIERADKHITDLKNAIRFFLDSKPYKITTKRNPQTRQLIYYVADVAAVPYDVPLITGDILNGLRSSLDHLAQQLYLVGTGGESGFRDKTSFPISPSAKDFKSGLARKVEGMRQDAIDAIRVLEPYGGGNGADLWTFHRINNIDKHRLVVTAGSAFRSVGIGGFFAREFEKMGRPLPVEAWQDVFMRSANNLFPVKNGDELFTDAPDAEHNDKIKFRFDVALHEPGIIEGQPILEAVVQFRDRISGIVDAFKPCLS